MELNDVKQALRIDFDDHDDYIKTLMDAAISRAKAITGLELHPIIKSDYPEIYQAIIDDIGAAYQNQGDASTICETSIRTYRRLSRRPML